MAVRYADGTGGVGALLVGVTIALLKNNAVTGIQIHIPAGTASGGPVASASFPPVTYSQDDELDVSATFDSSGAHDTPLLSCVVA
jgi:hypothetical protein